MMTLIKQGSEPVGDAGDQYIGLDRFGRLVDSRWIDSTPADINRVQYGYSQASNKVWRQNLVQTTGQDEYYTYDGLYQLDDLQRGTLNGTNTGISGTPDWEEDFTYDPIGNWQNYLTNVSGSTTLDQNRTQNKVNETTAIAGSSSLVAYDKAGNMTTTPVADWGGDVYTLAWDAWNRPVDAFSGGSLFVTYAYDGLNRRTIKDTGTARHYYYSSAWQILEERTGSSTSADRQFLWGQMGIDDLILRDTFSGSPQRFYVMGDGMSVTAIGDTSGTIQERYGYNAFSGINFMDASFGSISSSAYGWETLFCGYRWDDETGFYQVRNRYLHSQMGRWLSRDPIGEEGGMNLYTYVENEPIGNSDALGLQQAIISGSNVYSGGYPPPDSPTCCCCAEDIKIKNVQDDSRATQSGHKFDVEVKLSYTASKNCAPCTLQWNEKANLPNPNIPGLLPNKWYDLYKIVHNMPGVTSPVWADWDNPNIRIKCPGEATVLLHDAPHVPLGFRTTVSRKLDFDIVVSSGKGCNCKNQVGVSVQATQILDIKNDKVITHSFDVQ